MKPSTQLRVPYRLDFEARYAPAPLWSVGADVWVRVELASAPDAPTEEAYRGLMTSFFMLASTGALCGDSIEPWRSEFADFEALATTGNVISYRLRGCLADEMATVVCANTLAIGHARAAIRRIVIAGPSGFSTATEQVTFNMTSDDPYPLVYSNLPFRCDFQPAQDAPSIVIELASEPDETAEETLRSQILTWAAASAGGCYAAVLAPPADCYIAFDPADIQFVDDVVTFGIAKFRSHEAALRGLVNACAALHPDLPITSIVVE